MTADNYPVTQATCPDAVRRPRRERVNTPAPTEQTGYRVRDWLVVGAEGWIYPGAIYRDHDDRLWCDGSAGIDPLSAHEDHRTVHVLRSEHGVRVLEWPSQEPGLPELVREGNYFPGDCWVVEFPTTEAAQ